jgi:hypothetical protein
VEALRANPAYARARQKYEQELRHAEKVITKAAVARRAGVSVVFLRKHPDLVQAIEEAEHALLTAPPKVSSVDTKPRTKSSPPYGVGSMR